MSQKSFLVEYDCWVFKTVKKEDSSFQTIDSYEDNISEYYNYDSLVPNFKQIKKDDIIIIIDKKKIIGFARIASIDISKGEKIIRRCIECQSTTIDKRKTKTPKYRCNKGHVFDSPVDEARLVTKYRAVYDTFLSVEGYKNDLLQLRSFYINGYNQNMSIQRLNSAVLEIFDNIERKLGSEYYNANIFLEENHINEDVHPYTIQTKDERLSALQLIKLRRGQQSFRNKLLNKYNCTCVITGCKVIDILEAAHIKPYRGENDHHQNNGLLLRADIHTLFDLNLIAINPFTFEIVTSELLADSEYLKYNKQKLLSNVIESISKDALEFRWKIFLKS